MPLQPFRPSGGAPTRLTLTVWVLLLLVPACFAVVTMPMALAAAAITLTFGLPFAIWFARHAHGAGEFRAKLPNAIRSAVVVSVTGLGLVGLYVFSAALAVATLAAYIVTIGLTTTWGSAPSGARPGAATAPTHETSTTTDDEGQPSSVMVTPDLARQMSDAELCDAWRRSFTALQQARVPSLRAMVVQSRQRLLDEVEARHPTGLQAWLESGAGAAGSLDRFLGRAGGDDGHPEAA